MATKPRKPTAKPAVTEVAPMAPTLTRISKGLYHLAYMDRKVGIQAGLKRDWYIIPIKGVAFEKMQAAGYSDAKTAALKVLMDEPSQRQAADEPTSTEAARSDRAAGGDPLDIVDDIRRQLRILERALTK